MNIFFGSISLLITLILYPAARAQEPAGDSKSLYQEGIRQYQDSHWQEAGNSFKKALMQDPDNPFILYNLGLAVFRLEREGEAIAYWRKALTELPGFDPARRALGLGLERLGQSQLPGELSTWERFRSLVLVKFRQRGFYLLSAAFFLAMAWTSLSYFGRRKNAVENGKPLPSLPYMPVVYAIGFLLSSTLLTAKLYDSASPRGTVIGERVKAKSGPDPQSSDLFDLTEATEVLLRSSQDGWLQVSYPDGLTGWVLEEQVFQTSGEPL